MNTLFGFPVKINDKMPQDFTPPVFGDFSEYVITIIRCYECENPAVSVERNIETKEILRWVCREHAESFNPLTEFVSIDEVG